MTTGETVDEGRLMHKGECLVVLEMKKKGDTFSIDYDRLRYITHLPNRSKDQIEKMIKDAAPKNPADEALLQGTPTGTDIPEFKENISQGPYIVKDYAVMALLGLDRDNDDWRSRGQRSAYA